MRLVTDRCIQCGTPTHPSGSITWWLGFEDYVDSQGHLFGTEYWVCCNEHLMEILSRDVDSRYRHPKQAEDDPYVPDHHIEEFIEAWRLEGMTQYVIAMKRLSERLCAEYQALLDKREAEEQEQHQRLLDMVEKEAERRRRDAERELAQMQREAERKREQEERKRLQELRDRERREEKEERLRRQTILDQQRQEDRADRLIDRHERREERRERLDEKEQKQRELEEAARIEEEKWTPRKLDL